MNEHFELGEIAILQKLRAFAQSWNGEEVEITGRLALRWGRSIEDGHMERRWTYVIKFRGETWLADPRCLRKKRPPAQKSSWDHVAHDTGWDPRKVAA